MTPAAARLAPGSEVLTVQATPRSESTSLEPRPHVHRRNDWRPCPALYPPPLVPTKPAAILMFEFADAIAHDVTFAAFLIEHGEEFGLTAAEPFDGTLR